MEFLATFGMAAKNMFDYNRENFQFDQEQRLSRELLRQILQLKRFTLFREDIRDLVELTVGKMEMYHLVAALFMESSMALYFEGRIHHVAPPFILSLLYISIASAFMYLLLAVWLSMHASICSHSFGVRLLTRFVRLPVPGMQQMGVMNARLADFERQGVQGMLRVPVIGGRQDWMQRQPLEAVREDQENPDLLGEGIKAWNKEDNIMKSAQGTMNKHVDLFRRLQCKWQCFDAYARVCMALGANQLILGLQYYLVITTIIQYRRAPDGLLIWSSGEEVWEWIMPGSNAPQEVIYADVFADAQSQGDHAKLASGWRLGHFEIDLVALDQKVEDQLPQRLVSNFFTPSEAAGDSNKCFVGKARLSLQISWERRGHQRTAELRRETKEVNRLVDEVLQEECLELVDGPDPRAAEERLLAEQLAESRLKAALRRQQELQEEWHCDSVRKGISMTQWASKELWDQRCGDESLEEEEMLCPPQELLAEQLIYWKKRLHEVEKKCSTRKQRRPSSPRRSTTRLERHRLGPCVAILPDQVEVHSTRASTESLLGDRRSYSLGLEALLENRRSPRGLDPFEDRTSEVSRFLRQHRGLPEAQQLLSSLPTRPLHRLRAIAIEALEGQYGSVEGILHAFHSYGAVNFQTFQHEVMRVSDLSNADVERLWYSLSPVGRCISMDQLGEFLVHR